MYNSVPGTKCFLMMLFFLDMKKIKALLLAAGYGKRLRPLTLKTPKCLVEVNGRPLLSYWLEKLENLGWRKGGDWEIPGWLAGETPKS